MYAHKVIQALRDIRHYPPATKMGNGWPLRAALPTALFLAERIESAPKFDVSLDAIEAGADVEECKATIIAMGEMNLLQLPFPEVYVEFPTTDPNCTNFMLCWQRGNHISVFASHFDRRAIGARIHTNYFSYEWNGQKRKWDCHYHFFYGPNGTLAPGDPLPEIEPISVKLANTSVQQLGTFLVLLSTRNTTLNTVEAPKALNKRREKKGKTPLFSHTVIDINREQIDYVSAGNGSSHASPRIHLRRGHVRTLSEGRKTFVRPCIVGVRDRGISLHDYRVR